MFSDSLCPKNRKEMHVSNHNIFRDKPMINEMIKLQRGVIQRGGEIIRPQEIVNHARNLPDDHLLYRELKLNDTATTDDQRLIIARELRDRYRPNIIGLWCV